ncbi:MAG: site-specific DNA-methyltransferase [Bacteroidales bacterium]|nr:site-specific DNA-methyltransferase [Bacteroidales bacterium]
MKNKDQKAERESLDIKDKILSALKISLPEVISEGKVNWDKLRQVLGEHIETAAEKFNFTWAGKSGAITNVLIPSKATLRPDKKESIKFDESENLFIEGDNLEVLKLLQKSYFEKVKMIYIDPPYNTGNEFVYKDDFRQPLKNYLEQSGQLDGEGNRLSTNTQASGRFHSDWLNMMYPRLKLAWNLLQHDGVIFISIDDHEAYHLRMIMDEIYGEENFVAQLVWKKKYGGGAKTKYYVDLHEYIIVYAKNINSIDNIEIPYDERLIERYYKYKDKKYPIRGPYRLQPLATNSNDERPNLRYPIIYNGKEIWPEMQWQWSKERTDNAMSNDEIVISKSKGKASVNFKQYLKDENGVIRTNKPFSIIEGIYTQHGTNEISEILGNGKIFPFPKPSGYVKELAVPFLKSEEIIVDFFSGSATTAHAVLDLNKKDGGNRKFIMVQMPGPTDSKSEAYKAGYKTIADIGKERIRRVIKGYGDHKPINDGFKVFKLDNSNYADNLFEYDPERTDEENKKALTAYLDKAQKELFPAKINELDIVYENIIKEGLNLNAQVEEIKIGKNKTYKVIDSDRELFICLDEKLSDSAIDLLTAKEYKEKILICFDGALSDSDKANLSLNLTLKTI